MLEEEIAYLKKSFEMEMGLMKDENDILKKELMDSHHRRRRDQVHNYTPNNRGTSNNNYCSPIRVTALNEFDDMSNNKSMYRGNQGNTISNNQSPFNGQMNSANGNMPHIMVALKNDLMDKERIIECKNKEIISLTLQIEEIISSQSKINNSTEIESIRRNILAELSEMLYRLR